MSHAKYLETSENSFLMQTKAKRLPRTYQRRILSPPFSVPMAPLPWILVENTLFKVSSQHQHLFLTMFSYVKPFKRKFCKSPGSCHSFHAIFAMCFTRVQLSSAAATNPLVTTKAFTLHISFPVATGYTWESKAGLY